MVRPSTLFSRRTLRWFALLALLNAAALAALAAIAYQQGLRVGRIGWRDGVELNDWQWRQDGCLKAAGTRLVVRAWRPVRIEIPAMRVGACGGARGQLPEPPPPWTPPFDLAIGALSLPGLPPIGLTVHQRAQQWQVEARYRHGAAVIAYDRLGGRWSLQGRLPGADLSPAALGELTLAGRGLWLPQRLEGTLHAAGRGLGYRDRPQRTDAVLDSRFNQQQWQLNVATGTPLALPDGWSLAAGQSLAAAGDLSGIRSLHARLNAAGPQGRVELALDNAGDGLAHGQGRLTLSGPGMSGTVPLSWQQRTVTLAPAALALPDDVALSWPKALVVPLAPRGRSAVTAMLRYRQLRLDTRDSALAWQPGGWSWQGRLLLAGRYAGYALSGDWLGNASAAGLAGAPAHLTLAGRDARLSLVLPVDGLGKPRWSTRAQLSGHYRGAPLAVTVAADYRQERLAGSLAGSAALPFYGKGGALKLTGRWRYRQGALQLEPGSQASLAEGLIGKVLIKPVSASAATPLQIGTDGVHGRLKLAGAGVVASRWSLPAAEGTVTLAGLKADARLALPAWHADIKLAGALARHGEQRQAAGTLALSAPLNAAMSRGFGVTLKRGRLDGNGSWQWRDGWHLAGDLRLADVTLDWGGITAGGGNGAARLTLDGGAVTLASRGPFALAEVNIGTRLKNVQSLVWTDFASWRFTDAHAEALGGRFSAAALQWPSTAYQPVEAERIDLAQVAALQNDPAPTVRLSGRVGGVLPILLAPHAVALQGGRLSNDGMLALHLTPSASISAMGQSNRAVQLALDTISDLAIYDFLAKLDMQTDGWLNAAVGIKGTNPQRQPIVLNYTHRENVLELLRSLRIGDEISQRVSSRQPAAGPH